MSFKIGPGLIALVTVVFVTLKLVGTVSWSWVWVLSPLWLPFAILFGFMLITLTFAIVMAWIDTR